MTKTLTDYIELIKAGSSDKFSLADYNANLDKIDEQLGRKLLNLPNKGAVNPGNFGPVQTGYGWISLDTKEWEPIPGGETQVLVWGSNVIWELQVKNKKNLSVGKSGNITNKLIGTVKKGYRPIYTAAPMAGAETIADYHLNTNGILYIDAVAYRAAKVNQAATIPKGTRFVIGAIYKIGEG